MLFGMFALEKLFYTCFCTETLSSVIGNCWINKLLSVHGSYVATIKPLLLLVVLYNMIPIIKATELHQSSHLRSHGVALCVDLQSCFERKNVSQWNPFWAEGCLVPSSVLFCDKWCSSWGWKVDISLRQHSSPVLRLCCGWKVWQLVADADKAYRESHVLRLSEDVSSPHTHRAFEWGNGSLKTTVAIWKPTISAHL